MTALGIALVWMGMAIQVQAQQAIPRQLPTVVQDRAGAVSAEPYFKTLHWRATGGIATAAEPTTMFTLEDKLPLTPTVLRQAQPYAHPVDHLARPVFVLGMDEHSIEWFMRVARGLAEYNAIGLVVQADNLRAWESFRDEAAAIGIELQLMEDAVIASGYGIATYPVVMASPELVGEGAQ
ncbi:MAG: DUF2859 domain-containing protein [Pseudomonadota bacterium]